MHACKSEPGRLQNGDMRRSPCRQTTVAVRVDRTPRSLSVSHTLDQSEARWILAEAISDETSTLSTTYVDRRYCPFDMRVRHTATALKYKHVTSVCPNSRQCHSGVAVSACIGWGGSRLTCLVMHRRNDSLTYSPLGMCQLM